MREEITSIWLAESLKAWLWISVLSYLENLNKKNEVKKNLDIILMNRTLGEELDMNI